MELKVELVLVKYKPPRLLLACHLPFSCQLSCLFSEKWSQAFQTSPISNHLERQASRKRVCFCTCTLSGMSVAQKDRILCYGWSQDQCQSQSFKWQPIQRPPYVFSGFSESCYPRFTVTLNPVIWGHHTTRLTETFHCTHCSDVVILYLQTPQVSAV